MADIHEVLREYHPIFCHCMCGGDCSMSITGNTAEWRCRKCGVLLVRINADDDVLIDNATTAQPASESEQNQWASTIAGIDDPAAFMREVREVLGGVEWVKDRRFSEMYCPSCHMYQIGGISPTAASPPCLPR